MAVIWTNPDSGKLHLAWNPILFRAEVTGTEKAVSLIVQKGASGSTESVTLRSAVRNGQAEIDVAPIVRGWFDDRLEVTESQLQSKYFYEDRTASVRFRVGSYTYTALNGVAQAGEPTALEYDGNGRIVLTRERMLYYRQYEPYKANPQFVLMSNTAVTMPDGTRITAHTAYRCFAVQTQQMQSFLRGLGFQWALTWCARDISVRWRNAMGGTDTFLFSGRAYETEKVKSTDYVARSYDSREGYPLRAEATRTLKLHAVVADSVERRNSLRELAESPCVEVFKTVYEDRSDGYVVIDTARSAWIRCGIENCSISKATDDAHLNYELELRMPELNLRQV